MRSVALALSLSLPLFGASLWPVDGETKEQALARSDSTYGRLPVLRSFHPGLPQAWEKDPYARAGRDMVVSFKEKPLEILSGKHDKFFSDWFAAAPKDRTTWWSYFHEPEDNIERGEFTAADYRAAFTHLDGLADKVGNPRLRTTLILMDWSLDPRSKRDWRDYYPGKDVVDVQAWDMYDFLENGKYLSMEEYERRKPTRAVTAAEGNEYAIAEFGGAIPEGRPQWLADVAAWARANDAVFVTYFDSVVKGDWRLKDKPSQDAWRAVVSGS
ncbi:hypothetical protein [Allokutzneria oryzae]|uniref:GH26 domain-containing protein n=1 Tax=Allokutzneria oryzae TaxID=1378989 RepID=A0ABV5ZP39_9PSEU